MDTNDSGWHEGLQLNDLLILGSAIIRRHDKGEMTDETIRKYVDGVTVTYDLTVHQAQLLEAELKKQK